MDRPDSKLLVDMFIDEVDNSQVLIRKIQSTRDLTSAPLYEISIPDVMTWCLEDLEKIRGYERRGLL